MLKLYKCELPNRFPEFAWCDTLIILADNKTEAKTIYKNHFTIKSVKVTATELEMKKGIVYRHHYR